MWQAVSTTCGVSIAAASSTTDSRVLLTGRQKTNASTAGIKERFGDDIFEYLEKHQQMDITWPSSDPASGGKRTWMLTHQVGLVTQCKSTDRHSV